MESKIQDPKIRLKRNYSSIVLGKQYSIIKTDKDSLNLQNFNRNLYGDILIMKRYYSFLHKDGIIKFLINGRDEKYYTVTKISIFDYPLLHHVTLLEHGINPKSFLVKLKKIFIGYVYLYIVSLRINLRKYKTQKQYSISEKNMLYIKDFCKNRNVNVEFIDVSNQSNESIN